MTWLSSEDANKAMTQAIIALKPINLDHLKRADDSLVEEFMALLRARHEGLDGGLDGWIEDYQRRKREEDQD